MQSKNPEYNQNYLIKLKYIITGVIPPRYKKYGMDFPPKYGQNLENMDIFNALLNHFVPVLGILGEFVTICACSSLHIRQKRTSMVGVHTDSELRSMVYIFNLRQHYLTDQKKIMKDI